MIPHERSLVARLADKPFALLGINNDQDRNETRRRCQQEGITWRNWFDGYGGPITRAWGVHAFPTIYVVDANGVIRYQGVRGEALDRAVDKLLAELASGVPTTAAKSSPQ